MNAADANATGWRYSGYAGRKLKEAGVSHWHSSTAGTDNSSGFTAIPGGNRYGKGGFSELGLDALLWSATEGGSAYAMIRYLYDGYDGVYRTNWYKNYGYSVRCLKNQL